MGNSIEKELDELSSEADRYYQNCMNGRYDYDSFWRTLKYNSLEQIDAKIAEYEKKISELNKISTSNLIKKHKITISIGYLRSQLIELRAVRDAKIRNKEKDEETDTKIGMINQRMKIIEEKTKSLQNLCSHIYRLIPNNYFLLNQKKDSFIPEDWGNLPLNVIGKYDYEDNAWYNDNNGEWVKAFHGTGRHCRSDQEIREMINSILQNGFSNGKNNVHTNCNDKYHPGKKIGIGVYVTPNINIAKLYAGTIGIGGKKYLTLFLVKVRKKAIRGCRCKDASDYWVVNGSSNEIRPVRVLFAEM